MGSPTEVAQFDKHVVKVTDKNILWLDVTVDDVAVLTVEQGLNDLGNYVF